MRHADLRLDTVYAANGRPAVLIDLGKYAQTQKAVTLAPAGANGFGVLFVVLSREENPTEEQLAGLLSAAVKYRESPPAETNYAAHGFGVVVENLSKITGEWSAHAAAKAQREARAAVEAAERTRLKEAYSAVFSLSATEPLLAASLEEAGRQAGRVDLDIFVPDSENLLSEKPLWDGQLSLAANYQYGLNSFMKSAADAALRRGFGAGVHFTHLSTSRDLDAATRHPDGYSVPVEVYYEVIPATEYMRRLERVFV